MAALSGSRTAGGTAIRTLVLPVEWRGSFPPLTEAIHRHRPSAVILFGLHARAERLRLELTAHNERAANRPDAAGIATSGPVEEGAPATVEADLPLAGIMARLRKAGLSFDLSRDPGRYLCNDSLYRLCRMAPMAGLSAYGFVHVPLTDEAAVGWAAAGALPPLCRTMPAVDLERGARAICEAVADHVQGVRIS